MRRVDIEPRYSAGTVTLTMSASAPATSTPVGPPPTIMKFSAPRLNEIRISVHLFEQAEDP